MGVLFIDLLSFHKIKLLQNTKKLLVTVRILRLINRVKICSNTKQSAIKQFSALNKYMDRIYYVNKGKTEIIGITKYM